MKFKVIISLTLALVMLFTIAVPAFAAGGKLIYQTSGFATTFEPNASGTYAMSTTKDGGVTFTVTAKGLNPDKSYSIFFLEGSALDNMTEYVVSNSSWAPDSSGNLKFTGTIVGPYSGKHYFSLEVMNVFYTDSEYAVLQSPTVKLNFN